MALLRSKADEAAESYPFGEATSLTTLGYLDRQAGKLDVALAQCLQAAA